MYRVVGSTSVNPKPESVTKHIIVTGGVVSSLGKGLTASSLGQLIKARGLRVTMQKLDPHLNADPGTMNPFKHGEVFVTEDGTETDPDVGHYERFLDTDLDSSSNVTTGKVYSSVIAKERRGDYLGDTVQVIPHITDELKSLMREKAHGPDAPDVIITEIGGTVGDIESLPFLEAARQMRHDIGRQNVLFMHVSLIPFIGPSREGKTKPTQHSVAALRQQGIQPDMIVLRSDRPLEDEVMDKIASSCDVDNEAVVSLVDAPSMYELPKLLHASGLDTYALGRFGLDYEDVSEEKWDDLLYQVHTPTRFLKLGVVGKQDHPDTYLSVREALRHGGFAHNTKVSVKWVAADDCETPEAAAEALAGLDAICVPGGFGMQGIEGKIGAITHARTHGIPTLGICLGMQSMVVEYARTMAGIPAAHSAEFNPDTPDPVVATLAQQQGKAEDRDAIRLGAQPTVLDKGTLAAEIYGTLDISERHRNRYEINNAYRTHIEEAGLVISGTSPDGELIEFIELPTEIHPFFIGTQGHPEYRSRPSTPHPLFAALIGAALQYRYGSDADQS